MTVTRVHLDEHPSPRGGRLGRHVLHDPRSRAYAVQARSLGMLASVRHKRLVPPYDQGDTGSCTGNACAGALSSAPWRHRFSEFTARRLYSAATKLDDFGGSWPPDDTGSDGLSVAKAAQARGWVGRYEHAFSLNAALTALATRPVLVGMAWRTGCDRPDATGLIRWTGDVRGGHEIVADELDVEGQRVGFTQSWGAGWGLAGRFYMGWSDFGAALADQGDVTVLYGPGE